MENYYGGPKGLQGIQGEQGEDGFNFLIKGIAQDNTCETIDDVLAFTSASIDLPSFEENKWFVYYFNKLKISFGYSKDKNNNIQKIFLGYQHSGFWADNNTDLLKFSISDKISQENGNINFNFIKFEHDKRKILVNFYHALINYMSGKPSDLNAEIADVNNDGKISNLDKIRFGLYFNGKDVELNPKTLQYLNSQMEDSSNLILDFTQNNLNKKIKLLDKYSQNLITSSNTKENKKGDYYLNVLDKKIDGWIKDSTLSNDNVSYYEKTNGEVTFIFRNMNSYFAPDDDESYEGISETFTATIGDTLKNVVENSTIVGQLGVNGNIYGGEWTSINGVNTTFILAENTGAEVGIDDALGPNDIITEEWHRKIFDVVERHSV